jgi:hypothetical protein
MLDETLVVLTTSYDRDITLTNAYKKQYTLKTKGAHWDLSGLLRELADQLDTSA